MHERSSLARGATLVSAFLAMHCGNAAPAASVGVAAGAGGVAATSSGGHANAAGSAAGATIGAVTPTASGPEGPSCGGPQERVCRGESCCKNLLVPAGEFLMGRSNSSTDSFVDGSDWEQPEHAVKVSDFYLDKYEVTVARFRAFVQSGSWVPAAGAGAHPSIPNTGWQSQWDGNLPSQVTGADGWDEALSCGSLGLETWSANANGDETQPIGCVTWYQAMAFCVWDGGRLPTEAEWEYAAAGGSENRLYPWGNAAPDCTLANTLGCAGTIEIGGGHVGVARWGHQDLGGNLAEWAFDRFDSRWYAQATASGSDVANPSDLGNRVIRGGSYYTYGRLLRAASRIGVPPAQAMGDSHGLRCARSP